MNLTAEEVEAFRQEIIRNRAAHEEQQIAAALALLAQMIQGLPAARRPERLDLANPAHFPTLAACTEYFDEIVRYSNTAANPNRIPQALILQWPAAPVPPPAPVALSDRDKAFAMLDALSLVAPCAKQFTDRVLPLDPNFYAKQVSDTAGKLGPQAKLSSTKKVDFIDYMAEYKILAVQGMTHSFLSGISPSDKASIKSDMDARFPIDMAPFVRVEAETIDQSFFLAFLLLIMSELRDTDTLEIQAKIQETKMVSSAVFSFAVFIKFLGDWLKIFYRYQMHLPDVSQKAAAGYFQAGLGFNEFSKATKNHADAVDNSPGAFERFIEHVKTLANGLRQSEKFVAAAVVHGIREGQKAASARDGGTDGGGAATGGGGGRSGRGRGRGPGNRAAAATASTPVASAASVTPAAPAARGAARPLGQGQFCYNCKGDHKVFSCAQVCNLSLCTRKTEDHLPKFCGAVKDTALWEKTQMVHICSPPVNSSTPSFACKNLSSPTNSSISSDSDSRVMAPIQYDSGSNVFVTPDKRPFDLPSRSPSASDAIDIADGPTIPVESVVTLGNSELLTSSQFTTTLVPQWFIEESKLSSVLHNKQLLLLDA